MSHPWLVIFALIALGVVYLLIPAIASVFFSHRRPLSLRCPETRTAARVGDLRHDIPSEELEGPHDLLVLEAADAHPEGEVVHRVRTSSGPPSRVRGHRRLRRQRRKTKSGKSAIARIRTKTTGTSAMTQIKRGSNLRCM